MGWGSFSLTNTFFAFSFKQLDKIFFYHLLIFLALGLMISHLMREIIIRAAILQKNLRRQSFLFVGLTLIMALLASYFKLETVEQLEILTMHNYFTGPISVTGLTKWYWYSVAVSLTLSSSLSGT